MKYSSMTCGRLSRYVNGESMAVTSPVCEWWMLALRRSVKMLALHFLCVEGKMAWARNSNAHSTRPSVYRDGASSSMHRVPSAGRSSVDVAAKVVRDADARAASAHAGMGRSS